MKPARIALVSAGEAHALDDDLPPLLAALADLGAIAEVVYWDDAGVDWSSWDIALLRSTWDYTGRLGEFLDWIDRVSQKTLLLNPADVVRWSSDKHYLADLRRAAIPIVPSTYVEVGDDPDAALTGFLASLRGATEFVVKPCVGAGSRDARRHGCDDVDVALEQIVGLLQRQRSVVLQPYLDRVDVAGETALLYFDGVFSHAIRKGPLLRRGENATRALFAAEQISTRVPGDDERALAEWALAAIPSPSSLAYARVDLIRTEDGSPCVLELELVEPSLFFAHGPGSVERFARVVLARLDAR